MLETREDVPDYRLCLARPGRPLKSKKKEVVLWGFLKRQK